MRSRVVVVAFSERALGRLNKNVFYVDVEFRDNDVFKQYVISGFDVNGWIKRNFGCDIVVEGEPIFITNYIGK